MYSLLRIKRFYFGLSLFGSVLSQFLIFKYFRTTDLTYFITISAVILAVFSSYTSSASAALQYNSLLFSHHLSFRLMVLPLVLLSTLFLKIDNSIVAIVFAFLSVDALIPYISDEIKYYKDLILIKCLSLVGFVVIAFFSIYVAYIVLVAPLFIYLVVKERVIFLVPYGRWYNVLSVVVILSYTQLNYFLPLEVPDGINVFGLLDRSSMLLIPLLFNLFITNSIGLKQVMILLGILSFSAPLAIQLMLGYKTSLLGYVFLSLSLFSGFINASTVFLLNKEKKEEHVFLMILVYAVSQTIIRLFTDDMYLVYIGLYVIVILTNLIIKKKQ